jgi:hypothetical protein
MEVEPKRGGRRVVDVLFQRKTANLFVVPSKYVVGVTVGTSMIGDEIEELLRKCFDRNPRIPVYQAKVQHARYALDFQEIS